MNNHVEVLAPGTYSSIQDEGRFGFRKYGVPTSGAMDKQSAELANRLLNNHRNTALIEITLTGPKLLFNAPTLIAICGADISPKVNDVNLPLNKAVNIKRGDILAFGKLNFGVRCYLAVKDGFQTENVMNSYSYFNAITRKAVLQKGDQLLIKSNEFTSNQSASIKIESTLFDNNILECNKGPEFDLLNSSERKSIFNSEFEISPDNNRMGYRLKGMPLHYPLDYSMLTSAVLPGTVQLTPSGQLIVLMRDCQTTGGYPRTLQLTPNAINILSQKKASDKVSFRLVS